MPLSFRKYAGLAAIGAGVSGFLYSISFVFVSRTSPFDGQLLSALFLLLGGLFSLKVVIELYERLKGVNHGFALAGLVLGVIGSTGAIIHGGYDLANAINNPSTYVNNLANLPNAIDPRGLLTFGLAGIGLLYMVSLMARVKEFPQNLVMTGFMLSLLLILTYLGRLIILDPSNYLVLVPAAVTGFIVNPLWYIWLGTILEKE